jgi:UDP-N-acetylmuramyl pentapeptide phosphotransferase/UDP-N-acetylglucosamine-1-phosphate transferase
MAAAGGVSGSHLPQLITHRGPPAGDSGGMARGDHPRRTPVYGGLLIAAAMVGATLVVAGGSGWPGWARAALLLLALVAAVAGWLLTFRDATPRRRPR